MHMTINSGSSLQFFTSCRKLQEKQKIKKTLRTRFHTCYLQNQSPGFLLRQPIPFNLARESVIHSGLDSITVSTEESVDRITTAKAQKRTSNIVTYLL